MSGSRLYLVLLGILSLGLSSIAKADLHVQWISADKKLDCPSTCQETILKYAIPTGIDYKTGKPSFYICVTHKGHEWRAGYNINGGNSCISAFDGKEYHGTAYYCRCTNDPRPTIFR
jgi:hypothetical protein